MVALNTEFEIPRSKLYMLVEIHGLGTSSAITTALAGLSAAGWTLAEVTSEIESIQYGVFRLSMTAAARALDAVMQCSDEGVEGKELKTHFLEPYIALGKSIAEALIEEREGV